MRKRRGQNGKKKEINIKSIVRTGVAYKKD